MRSEKVLWVSAGALVLVFGALVGFGASGASALLISILGILITLGVGAFIARPVDAAWLPRWVALGFIVKLIGTGARYYMVTVFYNAGDSLRYHRAGIELAAQWRDGHIPGLTGDGSLGTQVVEAFTGALFAIVTPDLFGGFLLFSILAYLGQILLYTAFRRFAKPNQLKPYALLIFLLPTYSFWPSSIGKDALVLLALGAAAYCVARTLEAFRIRWLFGLGCALAALGLIRIHIAGLVVAAFVLTTVIAKTPPEREEGATLRRLLTLGAGVAGAALVITLFPDIFGVDLLSSQDLDGFTADVVRRTSESGTVAEGGPVTSPIDIPAALGHTLFRPYPFEATELQHFLAAAETGAIALLTLWRLPNIVRSLGSWRSNPYVVFATVYTLGFSVAFSVVRNLGIVARQRGQVLAFFLCLVVYLGWPAEDETADSRDRALAASS